MLRLHHFGHRNRSIVWLFAELGLLYELKHFSRDPITILSPPEFQAVHPLAASPLLEDSGLMLAESAAIVEYIIVEHGGGRLRLAPNIRTTRSSSTGSIFQWQPATGDGTPDDGEPRKTIPGSSRAEGGAVGSIA